MLEAILALGPLGMSLRQDGDWQPVNRSDIQDDLVKWYGGYRIYDIDWNLGDVELLGDMDDDDDDWSEHEIIDMFDKGSVTEDQILPWVILIQDENGKNPNSEF